MPTFTGETGERIRNMEARLAALEAGGSSAVGSFSIFHSLAGETIVPPEVWTDIANVCYRF